MHGPSLRRARGAWPLPQGSRLCLLQRPGQVHTKGDPQSGPLEKLRIDSEEAATTEVRPFLREVCSLPGQGPSISVP